jgi:hypothetical protein
MVRKIAGQVYFWGPEPSVVDKYNTDKEEEVIRIETPPGREQRQGHIHKNDDNEHQVHYNVLQNELKAGPVPNGYT